MTPGYWVYVVEHDHAVKVGISRAGRFEKERLPLIASSSGQRPSFVRTFPVDSATEAGDVEKEAHAALAATRTIGEWFHCHPLEACDAVQAAWRARGHPRLTFTMIPELRAAHLAMKAARRRAA